MALSKPVILRAAEFDPKLKVYLILSVSMVFLATIIGIPILLFWVPFAVFWWAPRHFEALRCDLTERNLIVKRGVIFRVEKTIPLEKIQDLSLRHGPLLNAFGLTSITVETAGQSGGGTGQGDAVLTGIVDAVDFRDAVLEQREKMAEAPRPAAPVTPAEPSDASAEEMVGLLREIRDTLGRIESRLPPKAGD